MCHRSMPGSPSTIHSAITLPMPPAPAMPCAQKPAATKNPPTVGLAEAELVVRRERLRPVDDLPHARRRPSPGTRTWELAVISSNRSQSSGSSRPLKSAGMASYDVGRRRSTARVPLVAAHDQAVDLLPEVDEQVGVAQGRQRPASRGRRGQRLGDDVLVRHRHDGMPHVDHPADLGGEHAAAVDDVSQSIVPGRCAPGSPGRASSVSIAEPGCAVRPARRPAARRPPARSRAATGRCSRRTAGSAAPTTPVGVHQREQLARLGRRRSPPAAARTRCAQPIWRRISSIRSGEDASRMPPHSTQPGGVLACCSSPVELDRVHVHPGQRRVGAQLADQPGGVEGRAAGQLGAVDEHDVGLARLGPGGRRRSRRPPRHR